MRGGEAFSSPLLFERGRCVVGWSCTARAHEALEKIRAACKQTQKDDPSSNAFHIGGKRYFYEVTRRDQPDGGVSGTLWLCVGEHHAWKVGTFRIDGQGEVVRGPKLFRDAVSGNRGGDV
jgi:hypothetical protein